MRLKLLPTASACCGSRPEQASRRMYFCVVPRIFEPIRDRERRGNERRVRVLRVHAHADGAVEMLDRDLVRVQQRLRRRNDVSGCAVARGKPRERRQRPRAAHARRRIVRAAEVRKLQRAAGRGRRLDAAEREVVELLERAARERNFVREVDEAMARQPGEQAVEAEAREDHVDVARGLARRDEQIRDVLAADRLLEVPHHRRQQRGRSCGRSTIS